MKNKIEDLRNHLFETLEALKDADKPMEIDRAQAIANVAKVIVDTAKAEVEFLKTTGAIHGTGFIPVSNVTGGAPLQLAGAVKAPLRYCEKCKKRTQQDPCEHCGTVRVAVA